MSVHVAVISLVYILYPVIRSVLEAQNDCILRDAHLLTITSEAEQAKITTIIAETGEHYSLGMRYNDETQSFEWVNGEEWTYTHFASGEPDMTHHDGERFFEIETYLIHYVKATTQPAGVPTCIATMKQDTGELFLVRSNLGRLDLP